jgi:hypothetical protein
LSKSFSKPRIYYQKLPRNFLEIIITKITIKKWEKEKIKGKPMALSMDTVHERCPRGMW